MQNAECGVRNFVIGSCSHFRLGIGSKESFSQQCGVTVSGVFIPHSAFRIPKSEMRRGVTHF